MTVHASWELTSAKQSILSWGLTHLQTNQSHFCCECLLHWLDMTLSEWFWWYLWPKMAFKMSQEFPTVFLDMYIKPCCLQSWRACRRKTLTQFILHRIPALSAIHGLWLDEVDYLSSPRLVKSRHVTFLLFLSLFWGLNVVSVIIRRNGRRCQHILALYSFLTSVILKGLTLGNLFWCWCMYFLFYFSTHKGVN